jgi:hypothetical protein
MFSLSCSLHRGVHKLSNLISEDILELLERMNLDAIFGIAIVDVGAYHNASPGQLPTSGRLAE